MISMGKGPNARRSSSQNQIARQKRHHPRNVPQHHIQGKNKQAGATTLPDLSVHLSFHLNAFPWVNLVCHKRSNRTKRVKAFGARPLIFLFLEITSGNIVGAGVPENVRPHIFLCPDFATLLPNHDCQLTFIFNSVRKSYRQNNVLPVTLSDRITGRTMFSPGAMSELGGLKKVSGSTGTSLPSSLTWS